MPDPTPDPRDLRFCIHSVTRDQRQTLESLDAEGRDCLSACEACFRGPYVCSEREALSPDAIASLLQHGVRHDPPACQNG